LKNFLLGGIDAFFGLQNSAADHKQGHQQEADDRELQRSEKAQQWPEADSR